MFVATVSTVDHKSCHFYFCRNFNTVTWTEETLVTLSPFYIQTQRAEDVAVNFSHPSKSVAQQQLLYYVAKFKSTATAVSGLKSRPDWELQFFRQTLHISGRIPTGGFKSPATKTSAGNFNFASKVFRFPEKGYSHKCCIFGYIYFEKNKNFPDNF